MKFDPFALPFETLATVKRPPQFHNLNINATKTKKAARHHNTCIWRPSMSVSDSIVAESSTVARSLIECGRWTSSGERIYSQFSPYFGKEVEIYTAVDDPANRILYKASQLSEKFGCATNKIGMFLSRLRGSGIQNGLFQATKIIFKPSDCMGMKSGGYFISQEICEQFEKHCKKQETKAHIAATSSTKHFFRNKPKPARYRTIGVASSRATISAATNTTATNSSNNNNINVNKENENASSLFSEQDSADQVLSNLLCAAFGTQNQVAHWIQRTCLPLNLNSKEIEQISNLRDLIRQIHSQLVKHEARLLMDMVKLQSNNSQSPSSKSLFQNKVEVPYVAGVATNSAFLSNARKEHSLRSLSIY